MSMPEVCGRTAEPAVPETLQRRLPLGLELNDEGATVRIWGPRQLRLSLVLDRTAGEQVHALTRDAEGYFTGFIPAARAGDRYWLELADGRRIPDPLSRYQPDGPHGPSQIIDPAAYHWQDAGWPGVRLPGQVLYELHIGTFTTPGTWSAAADELPALADLGITLLEIMPVAEFAGRFGWGYDGVQLFAPTRLYGQPDDFRAFVDRAHALGIGVILDVVYNHFGPAGNYLPLLSEDFCTDRYKTEWGAPINFDGPRSGPVREFFLANARYWISEFHLDGLRVDATQNLYDTSRQHIVGELAQAARAAAGARSIVLIAENEPQHPRLARPAEQGGLGFDGMWNDDLHHTALVRLTGNREAYYTDYLGTPQEFVSAVKWGFLYQGQWYSWQGKRRGHSALDLPPWAFIGFLQNHDQIANSARGQRLHQLAQPAVCRALTALLLLAPGTPLLFQGQEFASSSPFLYFADHEPDLARLVAAGRCEFLSQFPSIADPHVQHLLHDPADPQAFLRSKLNHAERRLHADVYALHRDLLRLRHTDPAFQAQQPRGVDGAVLSPDAFVLRFFVPDDQDRLLLVNLGADLSFSPAPEPLLAPPCLRQWEVAWSSESPLYGGRGSPPLEAQGPWRIPGPAACVLRPSREMFPQKSPTPMQQINDDAGP